MQNRGILIALRAAAIVIIVTGLNDVIASAVPRYEPLYLYLAAIALVALADGILFGIAATILSLAFYALLFMPRAEALSPALLVPAGMAVGVALAGATVRGLVRSRRRKPQTILPVMPPLLETSSVAQVTDNAEVLAAIDELRNELRTAIADLSAARTREAEVADQTGNQLAALDARGERDRALREIAERMLVESREEAAVMAGRLAELELSLAESEKLRADAEDLRRELAEERATRERLEGEFDNKLQTIVTHLASDHEADLGQALSEREESRAEARAIAMKLSVLQRKYDEDSVKLHDAETLLAETRAAAQAEIDRLRAAAAGPRRPREGPPRVMIVHPDADMRAAASATLERAGYEVVSAADGLEALRVAIAQQPDVVIAETSMPKMDGRELCQLLKSQEKTAHVRVVLLMRATDEEPRGELPPDEILRKPVPVETLKATLANLLARPASSNSR